jgi:hypothetical protein
MSFKVLQRRVMRFLEEANYVNTVNVADRVQIEFVWYPGEAQGAVGNSLVDPMTTAADGSERKISYTWARRGKKAVTKQMISGRITVPLAHGATGILTVFDTSWQITRVAVGLAMDPVGTVKGMQQRLNALGYHLRGAGAKAPGVDGVAGRRTENAVLAFQSDYRPAAGAAAPANKRLQIRGEWMNNAAITANLTQYTVTVALLNNPSAADSASFQVALVAVAGG